MTKAYVKTINQIPEIYIDDVPFSGTVMTVASKRDGILKADEAYFKRLGAAGVRLFFLICDTEFTSPACYSDFKAEAEAILRAVPDAYIILRVGLQPTKEWTDAHPEALITFNDGSTCKTYMKTESYSEEIGAYSLHAEAWKRDAGAALMSFVEKVDKEPFKDRIIGYFVAAGSSSEWLPSMHLSIRKEDPLYYDFNESFQSYFSSYIEKKYGEKVAEDEIPNNAERYYILEFDREVEALRGGRPHFPAPGVPTNGTSHGSFCDIEKNRKTVDFYMAWGEATAESILYFADLLKKRFPQRLVGVFYGYTRVAHQSGNFTGLKKLLKSPLVDFCAAPGDYENRQPGGFEPLRTPFDSYRLYNTVFFAEDDTRTHLENAYYRSAYEMYTEADSVNVMKRNFAKNALTGNSAWWFDQFHGGGRYDNPAILSLLSAQAKVQKEIMRNGRYKQNEIAFIYDTESRIAASHGSSHMSITLMKNYSLGRIGAPYDEYLLSDMENEEMPDYKLYIFAAAYMTDEHKREIIHKKLQKNHATALWMYGAGYINPDAEKKMSCDNIRSLTGFSVSEHMDKVYDSFFKICGTNEMTKHMQRNHIYGRSEVPMFSHQSMQVFEPRTYACPLFSIEDEEAEILGNFCDGNGGAFGIKEYKGFTSIWCGAKFLQPDFIREVAKYAGCHIYSEDGDVIYAGSGYVAIHASKSGEKKISLPEKAICTEVYEEKVYGEKTDLITCFMEEGETKMFRTEASL